MDRLTAGKIKSETVRLLFYSNAGGSVPFDVSGLDLIINLRVAIQSSPGGVPAMWTGLIWYPEPSSMFL